MYKVFEIQIFVSLLYIDFSSKSILGKIYANYAFKVTKKSFIKELHDINYII